MSLQYRLKSVPARALYRLGLALRRLPSARAKRAGARLQAASALVLRGDWPRNNWCGELLAACKGI